MFEASTLRKRVGAVFVTLATILFFTATWERPAVSAEERANAQSCDGTTHSGESGANDPNVSNYDHSCQGDTQGGHTAGEVGNADDQDPGAGAANGDAEATSQSSDGPGQMGSGPADANEGYECEPEHTGVQDGNPAHSGCEGGAQAAETEEAAGAEQPAATQAVTTTTTEQPTRTFTESVGGEQVTAPAAASAAAVGAEGAGVSVVAPAPVAEAAGAAQAAPPQPAAAPQELARTGSADSTVGLIVLAGALFALGLLLLNSTSRRPFISWG